jgi:signal peptidase II
MTPKLSIFLTTLLISLPLDQVTKQWIIRNIHYADRIEVIPGFFDLTHVRNPGGAFSFFADGAFEYRMAFFISTTIFAIILLLLFFRKLMPEERLSALALGMILGGALGNLIDRILYGEVIDFLDVHLLGGYTWPTFNVADSCIVIGVGILIGEIFLMNEEEESDSVAPAEQAGSSES